MTFSSLVETRNFWREAQNGSDLALLLNAEAVRLGADPPDLEIFLDGQCKPVEVVEALPSHRRRDAEYAQEARIVDALRRGVPILPGDREKARLLYAPTPRSEDEHKAASCLRADMDIKEQDQAALASLFAGVTPRDLFWDFSETELYAAAAQTICETLERNTRKKAGKRYGADYWLLVYLNPGFSPSECAEIAALLPAATEPAKEAFSEVWVLWRREAFQTWRSGQPSEIVLRGTGSR